mmetsp:Transcript_20206/g.57952  ORF Transcript_20206/g.57952 Transcript_20206/m.57952 type:complete len:332 (+) Transcript_20206:35-1030(+)
MAATSAHGCAAAPIDHDEDDPEPSPNDILTLNVAGEGKISVLRRTLCLVEGSMLATQFSGRWDGGIPRDADGDIFIDLPYDLFKALVDFLRIKSMQSMNDPLLCVTTCDCCADPKLVQTRDFQRMVDYYGLALCLYPIRLEKKEQLSVDLKDNATVLQWPDMIIEKEKSWYPPARFHILPYQHDRVIKSVEMVVERETGGLNLEIYRHGGPDNEPHRGWASIEFHEATNVFRFYGSKKEAHCAVESFGEDMLTALYANRKTDSGIKKGTVFKMTFDQQGSSSVLRDISVCGKVVLSSQHLKKHFDTPWPCRCNISVGRCGRVKISEVTYHI